MGEMSMIKPVVWKIIWQILCSKNLAEESKDNSIYTINTQNANLTVATALDIESNPTQTKIRSAF